jgi:hypothetical protein
MKKRNLELDATTTAHRKVQFKILQCFQVVQERDHRATIRENCNSIKDHYFI